MTQIAELQHKLVILTINHMIEKKDIYSATRYAWRINVERASQADFVLAAEHGLIVGVYEVEKWLEWTKENFPKSYEKDFPHRRWGFDGRKAPKEICDIYEGKNLPNNLTGTRSPIRYHNL